MKRLVVLVLLCGCGHVKLTVPGPDAPLEERQKAYDQLKPRTTVGRALVLANKQDVTEPIDLLPVVPPDSETAKQIAAYEQKNKPWNLLAPIAGYGFGVGGALMTFGLVTSVAVERKALAAPPWDTVGVASAVTGVILMLGIPIICVIIGFIIVPDSEPERNSAFSSYDTDLKRKLELLPP